MIPSRFLPLLLIGLASVADLSAQTLYVPGGSTNGIGTSSNGNVGIGVANPSDKLHVKITDNREIKMAVAGSAVLTDQATGGAGISFSRATDGSDGISAIFQYQNSVGTNRLALATRDDLVLAVGGSSTYHYAPERLRIEGATGNVGIGTMVPAAKLHIASGDSSFAVFGPNETWNSYLVTGSGSSQVTVGKAQVISTNGNLHLDSGTGQNVYIAHYTASNTFINALGGNVGIGTTSPTHTLTVNGSARAKELHIASGDSSFTVFGPNETWNSYLVTGSGPSQVAVGKAQAISTNGNLHLDSGTGQNVYIAHYTSSNTFINPWGGNVGIGTTAPSHKLAVNGTVRAKEVIVDTGWADYVFADDYELKPLAEVEAFIKEKKHLPGIPSAQEVAEQGVSVGEMQAKLLAKIEELTLHVIAQQKQLTAQQQELSAHRSEIHQLKTELGTFITAP